MAPKGPRFEPSLSAQHPLLSDPLLSAPLALGIVAFLASPLAAKENPYENNLSQKIILPLINEVTNKCLEKFLKISVEEICKIAKNKRVQKNISKKVDFDI